MCPRRGTCGLALVLAITLGLDAPVLAQRLPVRVYSTVDGLASDYVIDVMVDSRGFMWFSTRDGLSRFDGRTFRTYELVDGLPHATINGVTETRDGSLWLATNGAGVGQLNPTTRPRFSRAPVGTTAATNRVNELVEDAQGRLWAGTDDGAWMRTSATAPFTPIDLDLPLDPTRRGVSQMALGPDGSVWFCGGFGLRRRYPDGQLVTFSTLPAATPATALVVTREGVVLVGWTTGLLRLGTASLAVRQGEAVLALQHGSQSDQRWFDASDGLPTSLVSALHQDLSGRVWVGTTGGVAVLGDDTHAVGFAPTSGLPRSQVSDMVSDRTHLWIAGVAGVFRLDYWGLETFAAGSGFDGSRIHTLGSGSDGTLLVVGGDFQITQRTSDGTFRHMRALIPAGAACAWQSPCAYFGRTSGWWYLTTTGLWQSGTREGGWSDITDAPFSILEDSRGRVWVGGTAGGVSMRDPASGQWRRYTAADGLPPNGRLTSRVTVIAEDAQHDSVWIGLEEGGLARFRNGRFEILPPPAGGVPAVTALAFDRIGRLWVGSRQSGITRIDQPWQPDATVHTYSRAHGLGSNNVRALVIGADDALYVGHSRGIDRVTVSPDTIARVPGADGLPSQFVTAAHRDADGALWFGTMDGLARLPPEVAEPAPRTPVPSRLLISSIRVAGATLPLSEFGESAPAAFEVQTSDTRIDVEYFLLGGLAGSAPRFQFRLNESEEWSPATSQESIHFAALAAGKYALTIRALVADAAVAPDAVVAFVVRAPFYTTTWFLLSGLLAVTAIIAGTYHLRLARLRHIAGVRARIASDLHDDLGASLSQVSILAEVAKARLPDPGSPAAAPLERIADTTRRMADAVSDIIWAVTPSAEPGSSLVQRMQRTLEDTLGAQGIAVTFEHPSPAVDTRVRLDADVTRQVFLIFKEAINNIARHAAARHVDVHLALTRHAVELRIRDDGRGFDTARDFDGNGLRNLRRRATQLRGMLHITSAECRGTTLTLQVPLTARRGGTA